MKAVPEGFGRQGAVSHVQKSTTTIGHTLTQTGLAQDRAELLRDQRAERWRTRQANRMTPEVQARVERDRAALERVTETEPKPDSAEPRVKEAGRPAEIRGSAIMLDKPVMSGPLKIVGVSRREQLAGVLL
jgi:hypothetical protein